MKRDYTLVLKGTMDLSRTRFPRGTLSPMLDALARAPLWAEGIEFGHGTGHGVGYFLNVHEGPQSISKAIPDAAHGDGAGHDHLDRARRVPPRPVGRAHREPGAQRAGGHARGRRLRRVPGVRDADAVPDRHALHRPRLLRADEVAWLNALPRHGARAPGAARERRRAGLAERAHRSRSDAAHERRAGAGHRPRRHQDRGRAAGRRRRASAGASASPRRRATTPPRWPRWRALVGAARAAGAAAPSASASARPARWPPTG